MIRPEHQFDIRPELGKAASTKAESTTAETTYKEVKLANTMLIGTTKCIVECDKILIFFWGGRGGGGGYGLQLNVFLLFVPMAIYDISL